MICHRRAMGAFKSVARRACARSGQQGMGDRSVRCRGSAALSGTLGVHRLTAAILVARGTAPCWRRGRRSMERIAPGPDPFLLAAWSRRWTGCTWRAAVVSRSLPTGTTMWTEPAPRASISAFEEPGARRQLLHSSSGQRRVRDSTRTPSGGSPLLGRRSSSRPIAGPPRTTRSPSPGPSGWTSSSRTITCQGTRCRLPWLC